MHANYVTEGSFKVYIDYLALKRHFTNDSYDYHKYNGKVKASFDSFQTRNDAFYFYKLSKRSDNRNLIVSNLIKTPNIWIRELCEEPANQVYLDWKKKIDALSYYFKNDLSKLDENYKINFIVPKNGQYPNIMELFLNKQISLETFTILSTISNVLPYWKEEIKDKVIAKDILRLCSKYYPFLDADKKKFQAIVKEHFF